MRPANETRSPAATTYTPVNDRDGTLADALDCIICGRPLPEYLRVTRADSVRPRTVEEGILRILGGGTSIH
jgi:hypothetical protein